VNFVKMEGLGNDFVVVDADQMVTAESVAVWCDRRRGIGADGVLRVGFDGDKVEMTYWNADGSAAELCGNGLRCVALLAHKRGWISSSSVVQTPVGPRRVEVASEDAITVELGPAEVLDRSPALVADQEVFRAAVGNPHAVLLVEDVDEADVEGIGSRLEVNSLFPHRTNVEFAQVGDHNIRLRVWERGVGETRACGTGAAAAVAVTSSLGLTESTARVTLPGGVLLVEVDDEGLAWITGPARVVFEGALPA
jgi:diaminopimelate epimerase